MGEPYTFIRALLMRPARSTGAGFAIPENRVATPALVVVSVSVLLLSLIKHTSDLDHLHMSWDFLELNLMMSASGAAKQPCSVAASTLTASPRVVFIYILNGDPNNRYLFVLIGLVYFAITSHT
jgi:hypothetical protein